MKFFRLILLASIILWFAACEKSPAVRPGGNPDNGENGSNTGDSTEIIAPFEYIKGADISWLTQMEGDGVKFYNYANQEKEGTELMKELGFNTIRLRVWVDPQDGWCGKEDVLQKAARVKKLGMSLMIDFHYSDTWADPGNQNPPAAWKNYTIDEMAAAVAAHTKDVLTGLKDLGCLVEWVQVGNEVNNGMLHPLGKVQGQTAGNFVQLANSGYQAVKAVYPDAKVITHVSNGHDAALFDWFFSLMKQNNLKYDYIGMSLYPVWWENEGWSKWQSPVESCLSNIKALNSKFGKQVMICEFGMPVSEPEMTKEALQYIIDHTQDINECFGIFYWEPQTDGVWKPANYNELGWNAYNMGAFKNGKATTALDPFKQ